MTVRATVPVNLRPLEHARKLGNHFGLVFLDLPIGEGNPVRRLERIAECMNQLKSSRQTVVVYGLLAALGMAPQQLQALGLELFRRKVSAVDWKSTRLNSIHLFAYRMTISARKTNKK